MKVEYSTFSWCSLPQCPALPVVGFPQMEYSSIIPFHLGWPFSAVEYSWNIPVTLRTPHPPPLGGPLDGVSIVEYSWNIPLLNGRILRWNIPGIFHLLRVGNPPPPSGGSVGRMVESGIYMEYSTLPADSPWGQMWNIPFVGKFARCGIVVEYASNIGIIHQNSINIPISRDLKVEYSWINPLMGLRF